MKSPLKEGRKSWDLKGKGKAIQADVEDSDDIRILGRRKQKAGSQLKAGWKLQPLCLQSASCNNVPKASRASSGARKRSRSPTKAKSSSPSKKTRNVKAVSSATVSTTIEILSDSDEDIQEISIDAVASTSRVKLGSPVRAPQASKVTISVESPSQESEAHKWSSIAVGSSKHSIEIDALDLDNEDVLDLEEDDTFLNPEAIRAVQQREIIVFDDDDILIDDDVWHDAEKVTMKLSSSEASFNANGESEESQYENLLSGNEGGAESQENESDDDILELLEREDSLAPGNARRVSRTQEEVSEESKGLKPLSALRRSISPAASTSKVTSDLRPNAFTALMQGNNIDKKWAQAAETEKAQSRRGFIRPAPFYKILEGMTIAVDAFKYGKIPNVEAYFLSHAHSDHYTNLSSSWANGPIYCSVGTANLIKYKLGVKDEWLHPLPFDEIFEIAGVKVTLIDANHCPGSSIFVFEGPHTMPGAPYYKTPQKIFRYLHCGDFRASPAHLLHPALKDKRVDICYLDTTYLNPKYCFPAQEQVVDACSELIKCRIEGDKNALMKGSGGGAMLVRQGEMMKGWLNKAKKEEEEESEGDLFGTEELGESNFEDDRFDAGTPADSKMLVKTTAEDVKKFIKKEDGPGKLLIMVGTYSIGKERIVKGIARAIQAKVYCDKRKREIFECQDDPELMSMLTDNPYEGQIHVTWLGQIKVDLLSDYLDQYKPFYSGIIGLRPTGWTFKPEGTLATTLKSPSVIQMLSKELKRSYNPSWMLPTKDSTRTVEAYGVPYSEHSSFAELTCFAVSFDCVRFIPTVNVGSKTSRDKMSIWFTKWAAERKRRKDAGEPLMVPHRTLQYW